MAERGPMDCSAARRALWPPERLRIADGAVLQARAHIDECASCEQYLAQDREILAAYERLRAERAPRRVRERVFDVIAGERSEALIAGRLSGGRSPPVRRSPWVISVAAVAALLLGGAWGGMFIQHGTVVGEEALFVEDYLRRAVGQDHVETSDPAEVSRFLTRELGIAITAARLDGVRLSGAEICLLDGRRGAMIRYEIDGREISHYVVPNAGGIARSRVLAPRVTDSGLRGPTVVTWAGDGAEQALVGELEAAQLLGVARALEH